MTNYEVTLKNKDGETRKITVKTKTQKRAELYAEKTNSGWWAARSKVVK